MTGSGTAATRVVAVLAAQERDDASLAERICHACVATLPVDGAALSLIAAGAQRRMVGASDTATALIDELETTAGEGPGMDAFAGGGPVLVPDLVLAAEGRWTMLADAAAAGQVQAIFAFPIQIGAIRFGVLTLYRRTIGLLSRDALTHALQIADVVALALLDRGPGLRTDFGSRWLDRAGWTVEVDQATGMLIAQLGVDAEQAFIRLRAHAYRHDLPLSRVAREIIARRLRLDKDT